MRRRRRRRMIRYRPGNQRRLRLAQAALALTAAVMLALSATVIVRSIRTARVNKRLAALHAVAGEGMAAEVAAPPLEGGQASTRTSANALGTLSMMGMPDGTPIGQPQEALSTGASSAQTVATTDYFDTDRQVLPEMAALLHDNPDTVGWLSISGVLRLPVVYRDNDYYLDHDFYGAVNKSGTLFLDENHPLTARTQNLLIHGHSMNDGSMFGLLTHYRRADYLRQHGLISFSTLYEKDTYAVFAVLLVSSKTGDARYFNYFTHPNFATDAEFEAYIRDVRERSLHSIPVDVVPGDAFITLSTCMDDDRLVVLARRLRPGETRDELVSAIEQAY